MERMRFCDSVRALHLPLTGTDISWTFLLNVAQRRKSEAFLLHVLRCMDSSMMQKAAAALLEDKDPLTGEILQLAIP